VMEANELHVIVLDEFDAIARQRGEGHGGSDGGSAARDSVVNQLLALMDGVADLPVPTFVLALTNRRELVDSAVLRPGRLEVQVAVEKPDASGREAVLRVHAEKMRRSGRLYLGDQASRSGDEEDGCELAVAGDESYSEWIQRIAQQTDGFSAAAIAATVRAAVARALDRSVIDDDPLGCRVTPTDFERAIDDLRTSSLELETYQTESAVPVVGEEEAEAVASRAGPVTMTLARPLGPVTMNVEGEGAGTTRTRSDSLHMNFDSSLGDVVGGLHGGKYQFGPRGDAGYTGEAFAAALASSGAAAEASGGEEPWPTWSTELHARGDADAVEVQLDANGAAVVRVTNVYRTWEPFYASIRDAHAGAYTMDPPSGQLAPRGGANNVCDPNQPYTDYAEITLRTAGAPCEATLLVRTEEEQWLFKLRPWST